MRGRAAVPKGLTGVAAVLLGRPWKLRPLEGGPKLDAVGGSALCARKLPLACRLPAHHQA